jgi:endonuclease YncB( thermonuclease family)
MWRSVGIETVSMPKTLPFPRKRRFFCARGLLYVAAAGAALAALHASFRDQYAELTASFIPELPERRSPEPVASRLPAVIKLEPRGASSGPKVIDNGPEITGALGAMSPGSIRVVDADTIFFNGKSYRLVGYDTPEGGPRAKCAAERELAARAVRRLRQIVAGGSLRLQQVSCGCPDGTEGTDRCNHGRLCAVLTVGERDVAQILIGEGLARRYSCRGDNCPPRQPWC